MKWFALLALAATFSSQATPQMCFTTAGKDFGIDPLLLTAISIQESRLNAKAINGANRDKSEDVCGMQVNSSHYKELKKFNIDREMLLKDPCICTYAGAWVLARNFNSYGRNWDSVGIYNAGPKETKMKARKSYAAKINSIYRVLLAREIIAGNYAISQNKLSDSKPFSSKPILPKEDTKNPVN